MKITLDIEANDDETVTIKVDGLPSGLFRRISWMLLSDEEREAAFKQEREQANKLFESGFTRSGT